MPRNPQRSVRVVAVGSTRRLLAAIGRRGGHGWLGTRTGASADLCITGRERVHGRFVLAEGGFRCHAPSTGQSHLPVELSCSPSNSWGGGPQSPDGLFDDRRTPPCYS